MAAEDEIKSFRERGDAFVMWSVVLLLVLHLLIFPAMVKEKRTVNEVIGNGVRRLNEQRILLNYDLNRIEHQLKFFDRYPKDVRAGKADRLILESDRSTTVAFERTSLYRARRDLLAALQTNAEKTVLLSKSKYNRELKIPGTDTAIDEPQIRLFYPTALALWFLVLVFRFRNPLCRLLADSEGGTLPLWCAPVPYRKGRFWESTRRNLTWFGVIGLLARLFVNSSQRAEFFSSRFVYGLNFTAGSLAAITCVWLLAWSIRESFECLRVNGTN